MSTYGKIALLIVDAQYGFMPGGELPVPEGDEIVDYITGLAQSPSIDYVLATQDWHPKGHCSFSADPDYQETWPEHCVQGTHSAQLHERIAALDPVIFRKADSIDQDSYSGFGNPDLKAWLHEHQVTELVLVGLAADYCVLHTALDAQKLGFQTVVMVDGVKGVSPQSTEAAWDHMASAGIELR